MSQTANLSTKSTIQVEISPKEANLLFSLLENYIQNVQNVPLNRNVAKWADLQLEKRVQTEKQANAMVLLEKIADNMLLL